MTEDRSIERRLSAWLEDEAPAELPDRVFEAAFARSRITRRRSAVLWWRPLMTRNQTATLAVGAAAIVVLVAGALLLPGRGPSTGGVPSPQPTPTTAARATFNPSASLVPLSLTGQVAFARTIDGNSDIYVLNLNRSGLVRLTTDPGEDAAPAWSPDGTRLLFTRGSGEGRDVFVMDADGSNLTQLTHSPEGEDSAAFSPDGTRIAFTRYVDPDFFDMWVMDADGSNQRRVWHKDGAFASGPRWTADGKALLFNEDEGVTGIDIVRVDVATGALTPVAAAPADDSSFSVSADGSRIAFQSDRSPGGMFLMNVDGTNVQHLVGDWDKGYPSTWSPDAKYLMYEEPRTSRLFLVPIDGGDPIFWTDGRMPVWRPTG